jgi:phosphate transport system permease protein
VSLRSLSTFLFNFWLRGTTITVGLMVLFVFLFVGREALPFIQYGALPQIFTSTKWYPSEGQFGALGLAVGTLAVVFGGIVIAVPLAWLGAIALVFYTSARSAKVLRFIIEVASGTPSVIVGLFGLTILVPWVALRFPPGYGLLCASIVLSFLLIPSLMINTAEILSVDLKETLDVGASLRIPLHNIITRLIWPTKRVPLLKSVALATGRAVGETLAILMVAGNVIQVPGNVFESFRTVNATIALEIPYALGLHRSSLFFLGLLAFVLALALCLLAREKHAS